VLCGPLGLVACGGDDDGPKTNTVVKTETESHTDTGPTTPTNPEPPPPPPPPDKIVADQTDSGTSGFKECHGMSTHAVLQTRLNPPKVNGTTEIWSHCWFGGFTGAAAAVVGDADGEMLTWTTPTNESWGVNGRAEAGAGTGPSDRSVFWSATLEDPSVIPLAHTLRIVHTHAPRSRLREILAGALEAGKTVVEVAAIVAAL
jgi:hypothetical protein